VRSDLFGREGILGLCRENSALSCIGACVGLVLTITSMPINLTSYTEGASKTISADYCVHRKGGLFS
jgi:hypothetical protein